MSLRIYIPGDSAAVACGADDIAVAIQTLAEMKKAAVTIVRNGSRGLHWLEPMLEVETPQGRVAYGPVEEGDTASVLEAMLVNGGEHKLRLGLTEEIPWLKKQTRLTFARCGIVDPRSLEDYKAHDGYKGLEKALANPAGIVADVTESGLRGRGGAGFPTGIKWKTVADAKADQKYIVCNADEGDSGTFADRMIMEGDPFVLIEGMTIAGIAVGATKGYIYCRSEYPLAIAGGLERKAALGASVGGSVGVQRPSAMRNILKLLDFVIRQMDGWGTRSKRHIRLTFYDIERKNEFAIYSGKNYGKNSLRNF